MGHFLPFYLPNSPKNQNFEKMKKTPGDLIILHMRTKNYDQMMYTSWDIVHHGCNCYFSFWATFCPFTPLTAHKIKILKKWKKTLEISSIYISVPKIMIKWCTLPEIWCTIDGQADRQTDGWKKWHIEVSAPHKNVVNTTFKHKINIFFSLYYEAFLLVSYLAMCSFHGIIPLYHLVLCSYHLVIP